MERYHESHIRYEPDYAKVDLHPILEKKTLSDEDYKTLFYQTGLGRVAIDELRSYDSYTPESIIRHQDNFFGEVLTNSVRDGFTVANFIVDEFGTKTVGFELAPYDKGYVFVTDASYTVGWDHGHAALVTNEVKGETIEALTLGENSTHSYTNSWRRRPTFIMLRLKDASQEQLDEIASYASKTMKGIPYQLTVGLFSPKFPKEDELRGTNCSHLVWYPFMHYGYDIDSDGSWLVTPRDIMQSELFEVVQIYGLNPDDYWRE